MAGPRRPTNQRFFYRRARELRGTTNKRQSWCERTNGPAQNISHTDRPVLNAESSCCSLFDAASSLVGFVWTSVISPSLFFFSFLSLSLRVRRYTLVPLLGSRAYFARWWNIRWKYETMIRHPRSPEKEETRDTCDAFELTALSADLPGNAITPRRKYPKPTELEQRTHEASVRNTRFSDVTRMIFSAGEKKGFVCARMWEREREDSFVICFFRYFFYPCLSN